MPKIYDFFTQRVSDYLQKRVQIIKDRKDVVNNGRATTEANSLAQKKSQMKKIFSEHLEGMLSLPESIYKYQWDSKNRKDTGIENSFPTNKWIKDLHLYDNTVTDGMRGKIVSTAIDFTLDNFDEERLHRIFRMIFLFNRQEYGEILTDSEKDYYTEIATLMIKRGISELEKYMDVEVARLLRQDLERTKEICDLINHSKDKRVMEWA